MRLKFLGSAALSESAGQILGKIWGNCNLKLMIYNNNNNNNHNNNNNIEQQQ